jgi:competence protein ComEC
VAIAPRGRLRIAVVAAIGLVLGASRGGAEVARHEVARAHANDAMAAYARDGPRCWARATVVSSPVRMRDTLRWDGEVENVECDGASVPWRGRAALYGGPSDLARGDVTVVVATLAPPQRLWNEATGDPRPSEARRGVVRSGGALDVRIVRRGSSVFAWIDRARAHVRARIDATFPADTAPMARALVLGENDLSGDDDRTFRASGLSHLLAVSGMHLVLVVVGAVRLLRAALARVESLAARLDVGGVAAGLGIPIAWLYAELAGAGGSTRRAAWMLSAAFAARVLRRRTDGPRAFALSLVAMAVVDPLVAFDLSFLLSAAATAGLLVLARPIGERFAAWLPTFAAPVARAAATTVAASLPCAPILARFSPSVPLGGVAANLLAVPLGEGIALPLCLAHALMSPLPPAERGCAWVASGALAVVRGMARIFGAPALSLEVPSPTSWQLAAMVIAGAAVLVRAGWARRGVLAAGAAAVLLLEAGARRAGAPRGELRATFLDVGQGDAAIVDLPDGEAIVIDGGGLVGSPIDTGERVVAPTLRSRRRTHLAAAVLTHPHPDHFTGLASGLAAVRVGALWDTGEGEREGVSGPYAALMGGARARAVPILRPSDVCGARVVGGARIDVLAPCPAPVPDRGPNDNSFVMRIAYGARAMLFVGDAEREEEEDLLARARDRLRADVLKVGHHGSRTSSSAAFLAAVAPSEAVVSVGSRNRFGHPHPVTLDALSASGARVWRTDHDGAIVAATDGAALRIRAMAIGP